MRCIQATLEALGVQGICPRYASGVESALRGAGYNLRWYASCFDNLPEKTVKAFVKSHPIGKFYISVSGHAMALVDGVLTDTEVRGADGRRLVAVVEVIK